MKSLTEIQEELRKLSVTINDLNADIENLKPKRQSGQEEIYSKLEAMASKYPVKNKLLVKGNEHQKKCYIRLLSISANIEGGNLAEKLLYIGRVAKGSKCSFSLEEISKFGIDFTQGDFQASCEGVEDIKLPLLLDVLILTNMCNNATKEELVFVADLAVAMKCSAEDLAVVAKLASALMQMNQGLFKSIQPNEAFDELNYLIPWKWLEDERVYCGKFIEKFDKIRPFERVFGNNLSREKKDINGGVVTEGRSIVNNGTFVTKNMKIVEGLENCKSIKALKSGIVFFIDNEVEDKDSYTKTYIVSCFDDYKEICKAVKNNNL